MMRRRRSCSVGGAAAGRACVWVTWSRLVSRLPAGSRRCGQPAGGCARDAGWCGAVARDPAVSAAIDALRTAVPGERWVVRVRRADGSATDILGWLVRVDDTAAVLEGAVELGGL